MEGESQGMGRGTVDVIHVVVINTTLACTEFTVTKPRTRVTKGREGGILARGKLNGGQLEGKQELTKC
jgi:hypothetical protein